MKYLDTESTAFAGEGEFILYVGAGLFYWGSLLDGGCSSRHEKEVLPARATLYSALLPGSDKSTTGTIGKFPSFTAALLPAGISGNTTVCSTNVIKPCINHATANLPNTTDGWLRKHKMVPDSFRRYRGLFNHCHCPCIRLNIIDANVLHIFRILTSVMIWHFVYWTGDHSVAMYASASYPGAGIQNETYF